MKQLNLFDDCYPKGLPKKKKDGVEWKLFIDGASRKNPGIAGAGVSIHKGNEEFFKKGYFLGEKTNNQAEYLSLLLGLFFCKKSMNPESDTLFVFSDSELMVKHIKGEYRIKNQELKKLFDLAVTLLEGVSYSFCHILREYNKEADKLANDGIDKHVKIPPEFLKLLKSNGIQL